MNNPQLDFKVKLWAYGVIIFTGVLNLFVLFDIFDAKIHTVFNQIYIIILLVGLIKSMKINRMYENG